MVGLWSKRDIEDWENIDFGREEHEAGEANLRRWAEGAAKRKREHDSAWAVWRAEQEVS